jgi:predicted peptidase
MKASRLVCLWAAWMASAACGAQPLAVDGFAAGEHAARGGTRLPYRLYEPARAGREPRLPLIVYLHGSGGAGTDNRSQISGGNRAGTHVWTSEALQARHPAFVVAPQIPAGAAWAEPRSDALTPYAEAVLELVAELARTHPIDRDRVYLVGQSLGGYGTWDLVSKRPAVFAAAVPLCGAGNATRIVAARSVPIWAFHGAKDETVPVAGSRELVAALRAAGGSVEYTEYADVGHAVWNVAFAEDALPEWLFAQTRTAR